MLELLVKWAQDRFGEHVTHTNKENDVIVIPSELVNGFHAIIIRQTPARLCYVEFTSMEADSLEVASAIASVKAPSMSTKACAKNYQNPTALAAYVRKENDKYIHGVGIVAERGQSERVTLYTVSEYRSGKSPIEIPIFWRE